MKKLTFPIYIKLVFFILIILAGSLSSYVYYAVDTFLNDKVSYVYEAVDDFNDKSFFRMKSKINQFEKDIKQISLMEFESKFILNLLKKNTNILVYFEVKKDELTKVISYLPKNKYSELYRINLSDFKNKKIIFSSDKVLFVQVFEHVKYGLMLDREQFFSQIESPLYKNYFIFNQKTEDENIRPVLKGLIADNRFRQSYKSGAISPIIVSARKYSDELIVLSSTDYNKAIFASKELRENSLYFGLLIAGVVTLLVLVLSQVFTRPLNDLTRVVNDFLSSNFKSRANPNGRDEIGFLATSFNKMADDINNYMGEMEEKLRLEEELKTANMVQSQFFPKKYYEHGICKIYGHYQSATECGGDWWGTLESGDSTLIIIADVTGHGTAAALMTAVLHSSLNSLEYLGKTNSNYITNSSTIMSFLNTSFSKSTTKLNATAFVMCINNKTKEINYTNASHNPPFYFEKHKGEVKKSNIKPLLENNGPRLGESENQEYIHCSLNLFSTDKIFFYTDGILEAQNIDNTPYGQRKFIKLLVEEQNKPIDVIIDTIVNDFTVYTENQKLNDDYTIVGLELT